jgi:hypothetical protein
MGEQMTADLVIASLNMALHTRRPETVIHHSDQGSQYTSLAFGGRCKEMGVRPSMGTVGDAYDNAMAESFFASLECELIDRRSWRSKAEAKTALFTWIEGWYNPRRLHSALGYQSPNNFERTNFPTHQEHGCEDELPTAAVGSSQAPTATVDNSAPSATRPQSTYKSGKAVQTNGATSVYEHAGHLHAVVVAPCPSHPAELHQVPVAVGVARSEFVDLMLRLACPPGTISYVMLSVNPICTICPSATTAELG